MLPLASWDKVRVAIGSLWVGHVDFDDINVRLMWKGWCGKFVRRFEVFSLLPNQFHFQGTQLEIRLHFDSYQWHCCMHVIGNEWDWFTGVRACGNDKIEDMGWCTEFFMYSGPHCVADWYCVVVTTACGSTFRLVKSQQFVLGLRDLLFIVVSSFV